MRTSSKFGRVVMSGMVVSSLLLGGCGATQTEQASSESSNATQADDAKTREEDRARWQVSEERSYYGSKRGDGSEFETHILKLFERDEHGNVLKTTKLEKLHDGSITSKKYENVNPDDPDISKTITEYTYDNWGWPTKESTRYRQRVDNGEESYSDPTEKTFAYEFDDEGRLVKAVCDKETFSGEREKTTLEFAYQDNNELKRRTEALAKKNYDESIDSKTVTVKSVDEYDADGRLVKTSSTTTTDSGDVVKTEVTTIADDKIERVKTLPQKDGKDLVTTRTETIEREKTQDGKELSTTTTSVIGDGVTEDSMQLGDGWYYVVYMPDGSIKTSAYGSADANGKAERGEVKTYKGPVSVATGTLSEDGTASKSETAQFDGAKQVTEISYDDHGNTISQSTTGSLPLNSYEYSYQHFDEPSEFLRAYEDLGLHSLIMF